MSAASNDNDQLVSSSKKPPSLPLRQTTPSLPSRSPKAPIIEYIVVASFDHALGNIIEFIYPPLPKQYYKSSSTSSTSSPICLNDKLILPEEWRFLPFLGLPDGCHNSNEDYCFFSLPNLNFGRDSGIALLHGVATFKQIRQWKGSSHNTDCTQRGRIQKSIIALSTAPFYGAIQQKLWALTHAYFSQGLLEGFTNRKVLEEFFKNLNNSFQGSALRQEQLYMGLSTRELVSRFGINTLVLFKLLLLEKRVLFFGSPTSELCSTILSVVSLVPGLLASPWEIGPSGSVPRQQQSLLHASFGFPLKVFQRQALLSYLTLHQIDDLAALKSFYAATSNYLFVSSLSSDVVNVVVHLNDQDHVAVSGDKIPPRAASIDIRDSALAPLLTLSAADRAFMNHIIEVVAETDLSQEQRDGTPSSSSSAGVEHNVQKHMTLDSTPGNAKNAFKGSDEWIRQQFQQYLCCMMACVSRVPDVFSVRVTPSISSSEAIGIETLDLTAATDFEQDFIREWIKTRNFQQWRTDLPLKALEEMITQYPSLDFQHPSVSSTFDQVAYRVNKFSSGFTRWWNSKD